MLRLPRYERILTENRHFRSDMVSLPPKFQVEAVSATNHSSCHITRMNDLSFGIRIWAQVYSRFVTIHAFDRRADRKALKDRRTDREALKISYVILNAGVFEGGWSVSVKFSRSRGRHPRTMFARMDRPLNALKLCR